MIFQVTPDVFARIPAACFGVVVARGLEQGGPDGPGGKAARARLEEAMALVRAEFAGGEVKIHPAILPYREAFQLLGMNPNRFPSSIEAMIARIAKGGALPSINPAVDLANSVGLRYVLPLGVHDLDGCTGDLLVRLSRPGDIFTPFGETQPEQVEPGEVVYADGAEVRTRRWIWRQGEYSKSTAKSRNLFCPIDGFRGANADRVLAARSELAALFSQLFQAEVREFFIDRDHPEAEW
ncbi:MAG: B3/4 domain-containing protein [Methanocella sp.]